MHRKFYKNICRDSVSFWIIATVSLCIGLLLNQFRDKPLSLIYQVKAERLQLSIARLASAQNIPIISLKFSSTLSLTEFQSFVEQKRGLVLDARPKLFHRLGHVPGAISFPREDFENSYTKFKAQLEINKNQPLAVYCSGPSCEDSTMVQQALVNLGYKQVSVFHGGWEEWTRAELPQEKSP